MHVSFKQLPLLIWLLTISAIHLQVQAQTAPATDPCFDYWGFGPRATISAQPGNLPGLYHFWHTPLSDTNVTFLYADWVLPPNFTQYYTTQPGDTFTHQFTQNGTDTVLVRTYYRVPYPFVCEVFGDTTLVLKDIPLGREEAVSAEEIRAFPNPTTGMVLIETKTKVSQVRSVHLYALDGREMSCPRTWHNSNLELDLSGLAAGSYELVLSSSKTFGRIRLLKQ